MEGNHGSGMGQSERAAGCDVAVIGAGVVGAAVARRLQLDGYSVVVLEAARRAIKWVLPLVAVLAFINLSLGHAPFFTQARVGKDGRVFRMWKLRTMVVNADRVLEDILANDPVRADEWRHHQKLRNDPRVTPFGSFLRRTSLDELPQLWNVLIGDMSLVGPRPMLPQQRALYHGDAYFRLRPGVTGLWQVRFRNDDGFARRVVCDTQYDRSVTLGTDMALILATVGVLLRPTGH